MNDEVVLTTQTMSPERANSTHRVEVVPVVLEKHPNADRLSLVKAFDYVCAVATADWTGITKAYYCPPDSLVSISRPEFSFLAKDAKADGKARIKAKKIRGIISFGLLVPAPDDAVEGQDYAEFLGVEHYDPVTSRQPRGNGLFTGGEVASPPNVYCVKYDLEAGRRYAREAFAEGEPVVVTEKVHGANSRFCFVDGEMHAGSRTEWKKRFPSFEHVTISSLLATGKVDEARANEIVERLRSKPAALNMWWKALDETPALRAFCEANPGCVVYGEVLGCQDLPYGLKKGEVKFMAFDIMKDGRWLDANEARTIGRDFPWVPALTPFAVNGDRIETKGMPFDFEAICQMAEGQSLVFGSNNIREGVVVKTLKERYHPASGRVCMKWVSGAYLERSE